MDEGVPSRLMKKIEFSPKTVRLFLAILFVIVLLLLFKSGMTVLKATIAALTFGVFLVFPKLFFPVFKLIMIVSMYIGEFLFLVISTIIFFLVLTPLALLMRVGGRCFLKGTHERKGRESYYIEREPCETDMSKQY